MTNIEIVDRRYKSRILKLLTDLKIELEKHGFKCDEPNDIFTDSGFQYNLQVSPAHRPEHQVFIDLSIVDSMDYEGIRGKLNFEWKVQLDGGRIPFVFAPGNFTEDCWVRAGDAEAVEERFKMVEEFDVHHAVYNAALKALKRKTLKAAVSR